MRPEGGGETHPICKSCRDGWHAVCLPDRSGSPSPCRCPKCRVPKGVVPC